MEHQNTRLPNGAISIDTFTDEDGDHAWISFHAGTLDLEEVTDQYEREDGSVFMVKEISAYDQEGNAVKLKVFFDAEPSPKEG